VDLARGDLRDRAALEAAAAGQDVVLHLAFVIPRLSVTGVNSEDQPGWARQVNVGGTQNLLAALAAQPQPPRLVFTSSLHVYGRTQHQPPPRTTGDPVQPVEHYARHKVECERLVRDSGLTWSILRLPATLPIQLILDPGMFDVPLDNRIEYAHGRDVGLALARAVDCPGVWGRTLLVGGGPRCQLYYRDLVRAVLEAVGVGMLPDRAFGRTPYSTDWLDTTESQCLLGYQQRTLADYTRELRRRLGLRRPLIQLFRPLVRAWLLRQSPHWRAARP
jgi:nucleoside-diphosphate-sugar epimerase